MRALVAVVAAAFAHAADVPGETCSARPVAETCRATQDFILVVDNSYSVRQHASDITEFMLRFVDHFDFGLGSELSPRIGVVTFDGCAQCTQEQSARVLFPPSSNVAQLKHAIASRQPPQISMPMTCISCGLTDAMGLISAFSNAEAMPLILVLTDGVSRWGSNPRLAG